jgi:hypothetical protein
METKQQQKTKIISFCVVGFDFMYGDYVFSIIV